MLGGRRRDRIRVYQAPHGDTPEELAASARDLVDRYGFTAVKLGPFPPDFHALSWSETLAQVRRRIEAVRLALGDDVDVAVDVHAMLFEPVRALEVAEDYLSKNRSDGWRRRVPVRPDGSIAYN